MEIKTHLLLLSSLFFVLTFMYMLLVCFRVEVGCQELFGSLVFSVSFRLSPEDSDKLQCTKISFTFNGDK